METLYPKPSNHYTDIPEVTEDEDEWVPKTQSTLHLMKNWNL
ncbi:hypothetical protein T01_13876 [Trichinella spiralis]|uniref:Uncharacterized protein n=1 Tax=Trichinella spiralis TaxID=6334 RepID=A0A0V0YX50_TRISP|nr:hypothetical protein T01_13876 [Trichinella spiralis]